MPSDPLSGAVTAKFLSYSPSPFGLIFRGYGSGTHSIQSQRESSDSTLFALALQPLGGNVGIGTTSPSEKLDVRDGTITSRDSGNVNYAELDRFAGLTLKGNGAGAKYISTPNTDDLGFKTNNAEKMRITSGGNVGIGTTVPEYSLDVNGGIRTILGYIRGANSSADINLDGNVGSRVRYGGQSVTLDSSNVGFRTSSTERMRITSAGNVGIGTTNPSTNLHIQGTAPIITTTATNTISGLQLNIIGGSAAVFRVLDNGTERIRLNPDGNVGIGTTSPGSRLHIETASSNPLRMVRTSGGGNFGFEIGSGTIGLYDYTNTTYRWYINSSGNVGIGTTSPVAKLDIGGASGEMIRLADSSTVGNPFISFFQTSTRRSYIQHVDSGDNLTLASEYGGIRFMTGTGGTETEKMRIDSSGNVGIGRTSPGAKLDVNGDAIINNITVGAGSGNDSNNTVMGGGAFTSNSSGTENVSIGVRTLDQADASYNTAIGAKAGGSITTGNGNIVIGSLDRNGNYVPAYDIISDDDHISMGTTTTQKAYINVPWSVLSDARYKTEFNEIPHGLEFVKQLNPISYKLRKNKDTEETIGNKSYGFKAQDILALEGDDPVIIDTIKEDRLSYKESNLIPILVKAIQDLSKEVELLKQQINN